MWSALTPLIAVVATLSPLPLRLHGTFRRPAAMTSGSSQGMILLPIALRLDHFHPGPRGAPLLGAARIALGLRQSLVTKHRHDLMRCRASFRQAAAGSLP